MSVALHEIIKNTFAEIDKIILNRRGDKSKAIEVDDNYSATQDQREKSNVSLVDANVDDDVVLCHAGGLVKNEKDENENTCCATDLPSQAMMTSELSDDESSPKKSKQFTFSDSDLPDSDDIKEFLKSNPRPQDTSSLSSESESESDLEIESDWISRRLKRKPVTCTIETIEKLPERFMTRQRIPNIYQVIKKDCYRVLQSSYLKNMEDQVDEDIIRENIKRLKTFRKSKKHKERVRTLKLETKEVKSKSFAKKISKESTLDSLSAATTSRRPSSMKNKSDGKNTKNKRLSSGKKKCKRKPTLKKESSTLPAVEGRRSKRNLKTKEKDEDTTKASVSVPKKSKHEQSTFYSISSSSSKSPKSLKRSLVEDSDVLSPKRMRSQNNKVTCASTPVTATVKTEEIDPDKQVKYKLTQKRAKRRKTLTSSRNFLNMKTRSQSARRRTSTKRH